MKSDWEQRQQKLEQAREEQQSAARLSILEFRIKRLSDKLDKLLSGEAADFALRMTRAQLSKAEQDRDNLLRSASRDERQLIEHEEIAVGFLEVQEATDGS